VVVLSFKTTKDQRLVKLLPQQLPNLIKAHQYINIGKFFNLTHLLADLKSTRMFRYTESINSEPESNSH